LGYRSRSRRAGANGNGELGDGTFTGPGTCQFGEPCSTTPIAVSGLSAVTAVSAGAFHSLALLSNGTVMAWGANGHGQLGNGTITQRASR
jgi:alpha-tubulin suppressor-like RCC1 family protein